jgi:hypothetical protein
MIMTLETRSILNHSYTGSVLKYEEIGSSPAGHEFINQ